MRSAAFQAFLVVFGVVLAFAANEWRQARADRIEAEAALEAIREELAGNSAAVTAAKAYHAEGMRRAGLAAREGRGLDIGDFQRGFVAPAPVVDAAFVTAGEVGALSNLPFETVKTLSRAYALQRAYLDQQNNAAAVLYRALFDTGADGIASNPRGLQALIGAFYYREERLEAAYAETLAAIAAGGAGEPEPAGLGGGALFF